MEPPPRPTGPAGRPGEPDPPKPPLGTGTPQQTPPKTPSAPGHPNRPPKGTPQHGVIPNPPPRDPHPGTPHPRTPHRGTPPGPLTPGVPGGVTPGPAGTLARVWLGTEAPGRVWAPSCPCSPPRPLLSPRWWPGRGSATSRVPQPRGDTGGDPRGHWPSLPRPVGWRQWGGLAGVPVSPRHPALSRSRLSECVRGSGEWHCPRVPAVSPGSPVTTTSPCSPIPVSPQCPPCPFPLHVPPGLCHPCPRVLRTPHVHPPCPLPLCVPPSLCHPCPHVPPILKQWVTRSPQCPPRTLPAQGVPREVTQLQRPPWPSPRPLRAAPPARTVPVTRVVTAGPGWPWCQRAPGRRQGHGPSGTCRRGHGGTGTR